MTLFITRAGKDYGLGHVNRQINILPFIQGIVDFQQSVFITLCDQGQEKSLSTLLENKLIESYPDLSYSIISYRRIHDLFQLITSNSIDLIVLDGREFPETLFLLISKKGIPILSYDDYRFGSIYSELAVHPLPGSAQKFSNSASLDFQPFSQAHYQALKTWQRPAEVPYHRILVSFGGSDPAQIAHLVIKALYDRYSSQITLIEGPLSDYSWANDYPSVKVVHSPENLVPYYEKNTVLFTSIGLTLLEGLSFGIKTVCITPSKAHNQIAQKIEGIINLGCVTRLKASAIDKAMALVNQLNVKSHKPDFDKTMALYQASFRFLKQNGAARCPVCMSLKKKAIDRTTSYTLFVCLGCRSNYQYRYLEVDKPYDESYYKENHQAAYGKSYLEDEPAIRSYSKRRLKILKSLFNHKNGQKLVEVGSALGLFLDEARVAGFTVNGVEISEYARNYCEERFQIPCYSNLEHLPGSLDALCLWFTLEHMPVLSEWISLASERIKKDGIFAFSVPNGNGAYARFNRKGYIKARPVEHLVEPSIEGLCKILKIYGFEMERLEIFGLHPSRYFMPPWGLFKLLQKALRLGDTFEIYARKIK